MRALPCLVGSLLVACGGSPRSTSSPDTTSGARVVASSSAAVDARPASSGQPAQGAQPAASAAPSGQPAASAAPSGQPAASAAPSGQPATSAAPPEKIDGALPETKGLTGFPRRHACGSKGCNLATLVPDVLDAQLDEDLPVFMFEEVMPPKVSLLLPRVAGVDVYGFVLDGEVGLVADDLKGKPPRVGRMSGFRVPGAGVNVSSKEPTRMILALVVSGASGTVAERVARLKAKDKTVGWSKRASPVVAFDLLQRPDLTWGAGAYHARLGLEEPPASLGLLLMSRNAPVAEHVHAKEWEFLAILDGSGELSRKTSGTLPVTGATFAAVKPGEPHGFSPAGDKPTYAVQMYWPPGPEQRFKKLAEGNK
jgi:mannose-6-phosphate isomerase-like protein (cupin superfamily)